LPDGASRWWLPLGLLLLLLLAFLPLWQSDYIQDDHLAVESNPIVARGDLSEIFSTSYWEGASGEDGTLYRPVAIWSYALERRLSGSANSLVSHLVNVVLHGVVSCLLFLLAQRIGLQRPAAILAGLLFAVHPIHVEAVAGIVGRAELLAALFSLLALLLLIRSGAWEERDGTTVAVSTGRARFAAWLAGLALFLALGAKEIAAATLPLMLALEWFLRPRDRRSPRAWWVSRSVALVPAVSAVLVYFAFRIRALEMLFSAAPAHPADNPIVLLEGGARLATALSLLPRYAGLLLYPLDLCADYSGGVIPIRSSLLHPSALLGLAIVLATLALLFRAAFLRVGGSLSRQRAALVWSLALFAVPYLVISNLFLTIGTIFAERLIYFPSLGFCLLVGGLLPRSAKGSRRGRWIAGLVASVCLLFSVQTFVRCGDWRDDGTLFRAASIAQPASPRSHFILGKLDAKRGDLDGAIAEWDATLERYPAWVSAWFEKGVAYGQRREYAKAAEMFAEAVRLSPSYAAAQFNLGLALRQLGREEEARRALLKATRWNPQAANAWAELGNLYLARRDAARAASHFRRAVALGRSDLIERLESIEGRGAPRGR